MIFFKKIIIAFIILILTYVIIRFFQRKNEILNNTDKPATRDANIEHFTLGIPAIFGLPSQSAELDSLKQSTPVKIQNIVPAYQSLPLRELCIKGSYNSAYTGNYINLDMIKYVMSRGCRFLDFEVYYIQEDNKYMPKVGYTTDSTFTILESENSILLDNVLSAVVANGFSNVSPNNNDPIFINLRIKSKNNDVYNSVAKSIDFAIRSKIFKGPVTVDTPINKLMNSIVIIIDKTINRDYAQYTDCKGNNKDCYDLTKYVNMESGSEMFNIVKYSEVINQCTSPINILQSNINTDVKKIRMALPDIVPLTKRNPVISDFIMLFNCQIIPNRFYYYDRPLEDYEKLFDDNKSAFIPYAIALDYYKKIQDYHLHK